MYDDVCVCIYIYVYIYIHIYIYIYIYICPLPTPQCNSSFLAPPGGCGEVGGHLETKGALPLPLHQAALRSLAYPRNWHHLRPQAAFRDNLDQRQEQGDIDPDKLEHYMVFVGSK